MQHNSRQVVSFVVREFGKHSVTFLQDTQLDIYFIVMKTLKLGIRQIIEKQEKDILCGVICYRFCFGEVQEDV